MAARTRLLVKTRVALSLSFSFRFSLFLLPGQTSQLAEPDRKGLALASLAMAIIREIQDQIIPSVGVSDPQTIPRALRYRVLPFFPRKDSSRKTFFPRFCLQRGNGGNDCEQFLSGVVCINHLKFEGNNYDI